MSAGPRTQTAAPVALLRGDPRRQRRERWIRRAFLAAALTSVVVSALIVLSLFGNAVDFLRMIDLSSLWSVGWFPRRGLFDMRTLLTGSAIVTVIAMLVAVPLGLGAAIYLSEYARGRARRILKPIIETLASMPSVVLGFFALTWINPNLVRSVFPDATGANLVAAGIGVGVLVTPLMASISEDALAAVPDELREAAYGLGARRLHTTLRVVVPAAVSGIVAAAIISVSRAIGETMVVAIAGGGAGGALFHLDPTQPGQTLTAAIAALATGTDAVKGETGAFQSLFFVGLVLFALTLVLNVAGGRIVRRYRKAL